MKREYRGYIPLFALRRLRTAALSPASPVPRSTIVVGSGTAVNLGAVMVPLRLTFEIGKLPGVKVTAPIPRIFPVAPAKKLVPPVTV
ncbi:MAG: hypothetical protein WKF84_28065 [Pyrinomonadaceae bacterium]